MTFDRHPFKTGVNSLRNAAGHRAAEFKIQIIIIQQQSRFDLCKIKCVPRDRAIAKLSQVLVGVCVTSEGNTGAHIRWTNIFLDLIMN